MASYNLMKAADRARYRADHQAELDAVKAGTWPRDINDQMRWINGTGPEYAGQMCEATLTALDDMERRIQAGDPDMECYERIMT